MEAHNQKVDMLLVFGEAQRDAKLAVRLYRNKYPDRHTPDYRAFERLERVLRNNLSAFSSQKNLEKRKSVCSDEVIAEVCQYFENNPRKSIRDCSRHLNISYSSIQRILKKNKYHDYKILNVEELSELHKERRRNFLAQISVEELHNPNIYKYILWTDESRFVSNGVPNKKNTHYWATENPHEINEVQNQGHFGVNVWCGLIGRHLVGPFFYETTLTGDRYLHFLENDLPGLLEDVPLQLRRNMWLQQDGAPSHNARIVENHLNQYFRDRWIGTNGPIRWPPKSPDLTPLDFFLWGTLKNYVYKKKHNNVEELKQSIVEACNSINADILRRVTHIKVKRRLQKCLEEFGGHVEHLE